MRAVAYRGSHRTRVSLHSYLNARARVRVPPLGSQKYKEGKFIVEKSRVVEGEAL